MEKEEIKRKREEGNQEIVKMILEKIWRKEKEERQKKINESKYNSMYKDIITENLPKYLQGKRKRKDRCLIAIYRCGNEMKGDEYWRQIEDRICRICENEEESITHVLRESQATRNDIQIGEFLSEEGKGLEIMRRIEQERGKKEKEGVRWTEYKGYKKHKDLND